MKEYGFVNRARRKSSVPAWAASPKLIREIQQIGNEWCDCHPRQLTLLHKKADQVCRMHGYICLDDKWHFFKLLIVSIFEYEHRHCIRWMKSDFELVKNGAEFPSKTLLQARAALFGTVVGICAADMNTRTYERVKDNRNDDDDDDEKDDDEDCLLCASDSSVKVATKMPKQQSIVKDNIIALPIKHAPHS
jgi:hypothetical protein